MNSKSTIIDTHTHLYEKQFDGDRDVMIQRALENGVQKMLIPNVDSTTIAPMLAICSRYPQHIFPMIGIHPCSIKPDTHQQELDAVYKCLQQEKFVAVGEIGIDLYWDKTTLDIQKDAFNQQCDWALEFNLPIAIHSRDATHVIIEILKHRKQNPKGVFHCFTGSFEEAQEILKLGFYLGIGGVVSYKNTHLRETLKRLPLEKIVLETDAPYLPPVPHRGKRNESAYTTLVVETLCTVYEKSYTEIAEITTKNAVELFGIG